MNIELDAIAFDMLWSNRMDWAGLGWEAQAPDRFRTKTEEIESINFGFRFAYWFMTASDAVLARAYLRSHDVPHQLLSDEADGEPYLITTDYTSETEEEVRTS